MATTAENNEKIKLKNRIGNGTCCAAINCGNTKGKCPSMSFFRFPLDPERSKEWVKQTQRSDLLSKDVQYLHRNLKICAAHFEDHMFSNHIKNRLYLHGVPKLFEKPNINASYKKVRKKNWNEVFSCRLKCEIASSVHSPEEGETTTEEEPMSSEGHVPLVEDRDVGGMPGEDQPIDTSQIKKENEESSETMRPLKSGRKRKCKYSEAEWSLSHGKRLRKPNVATSTLETLSIKTKSRNPVYGTSKKDPNVKQILQNCKSNRPQVEVASAYTPTTTSKKNPVVSNEQEKKDKNAIMNNGNSASGLDKIIRLPNNSFYFEFATPKRQVIFRLDPKSETPPLKSETLEDLLISLSSMKLLSSDAVERLQTFRSFPDGLKRIPAKQKCEHTEEVKKFATILFVSSPEAYEVVSMVFALPDKLVVRSRLQVRDYSPGFTKKALMILKNEIVKTGADKLCSLMFDSFIVKKQSHFDAVNGKWFGHCNFGSGQNPCDADEVPLATEVLMFTAVGLGSDWKLPFGYFLHNGLSGELLKRLIEEAILILEEECGLDVRALVCNGSGSTIRMATLLGCNIRSANSFSQLITNIRHPSKEHCKIYLIFGIQQSLKLLKNLLRDKGILRSSIYGKIKWCFLRQFFASSADLRLEIVNLKHSSHVEFYHLQRIICLCNSSFSCTLVNALELADQLKLKDFIGSRGTFSFAADVQRGFYLLNSRNSISSEDNPPIHPRTLLEQVESMTDIAERLFDLELLSGNCIMEEGRWMSVALFTFTLRSVSELAAELVSEKHVAYFPTYRINLDHWDIVLKHLQRRGGWSDVPSHMEFQSAYKSLLESQPYKYNFEGEDLTVGQGEIYLYRNYPPSNCFDIDYDIGQFHYLLDLNTDVINRASHIIRKISQRLSCPECMGIMLDDDYSHDLKRRKIISNLVKPSGFVLRLLNISQRIVNSKEMESNGIKDEHLVLYVFREYLLLYETFDVSKSAANHHMIEEPYHIICLMKVIIRTYIHFKHQRRREFRKRYKRFH